MFPLLAKSVGPNAETTHTVDSVELAHYLRQATITRRRQSSRLNHLWCKHRSLIDAPNLWRH